MIENLENEIWADIPGSDGLNQVSNMGRVRTFYRCPEGRLMSKSLHRCGYEWVRIKEKACLIHRLVALMFVPNPRYLKEVNHKDGNKLNNRWDNLEWCTRSENMIHAFEMGLKENRKGSMSNAAKSFYQFDRKGNLMRKWGSLVECADHLEKLDPKNGPAEDIRIRLTATLHNRHKSCCGFLFSFSDSIDWKSKEKDLGQMPVLAVPAGNAPGDMSGSVRFGYVNETEGFQMPNGKKAYATLVSRCCRGIRNTCAGYRWEYERG